MKNLKNKLLRLRIRILSWIGHFQHIFWIICIIVFLALLIFLVPHYIWEKIYISIKAQLFLVLMGLFFCTVAISLVWTAGQRIDVWFFTHLNKTGRRARWLDRLMLCFTQLGNFIFALLVILVLLFSGHQLLANELLLGVLTLGLIVQSIKVLVRRTRPYNKLTNMRIVGNREVGHSFPSGHTSQVFFMASLLVHYYQLEAVAWLSLYTIAVLVGITRIYVGMHYPRDVIAGAILGTAWGILGVVVNDYIFLYLNAK